MVLLSIELRHWKTTRIEKRVIWSRVGLEKGLLAFFRKSNSGYRLRPFHFDEFPGVSYRFPAPIQGAAYRLWKEFDIFHSVSRVVFSGPYQIVADRTGRQRTDNQLLIALHPLTFSASNPERVAIALNWSGRNT